MSKLTKQLIVSIIFGLTLTACNSTSSTQQSVDQIISQTALWHVLSIDGKTVNFTPVATLQITDSNQRITGDTGCNQLSAQFERNGKDFTISNLNSTKRLCDGHLVARERQIMSILQTASMLEDNGQNLKLESPRGIMVLIPGDTDPL